MKDFDRVRMSVNPNNRIIAKQARGSSGPIPLRNIKCRGYLSLFVVIFSLFLLLSLVQYQSQISQLENDLSSAGNPLTTTFIT